MFRIARETGADAGPVERNDLGLERALGGADCGAADEGIDGQRRRGYAANIVLHDGGHRDTAANREPSVTAAGMLIERYKATHRFVTLDAWSGEESPRPSLGWAG